MSHQETAPQDTPGPTAPPGGSGPFRDSLLWRLLRESIPQHRGKYTVASIAMVFVAATTGLTAWILGEIVDAMSNPDQRMRLYAVAGGVAALFIFKGIFSYLQMVLMARAGNRIVAEKQSQMFRHLLRQPASFFNLTESSDLLMQVTQSAGMARSVIDTIVSGFIRDLLTLVALVTVMFYQQPVLSLISIVVGPIVVFGVMFLLRQVRDVMAQEMRGLAEIMKVVQEASVGARVIKSFGLEPRMERRMDVAVAQVESRNNKIIQIEAATTPLLDTIAGLAIASIVILSAISLFGQQPSTPGQLMSFVTAFLMTYEPARRLSGMRVRIEAGMVGVRMIYALLDTKPGIVEKPDARPIPTAAGEVVLDRIDFGYDPKAPIIKGLSVTFAAGKTTALVGPSGGGKSTILNIVMRLYDPTAGRVTIDGLDLRDATFASLRDKIAFVGQDTFLFAATVMENLRLGRTDATDEEVIEAARSAHAHEFISGFSKGYDTHIGENGAFLSGGQRQRIAIARAILRRAPILLLDEATSALDSHSEALVRDALEKVSKGRTTIVIAHRLSTVLNADRVCYLEAGQIVEQGTLRGLLRNGGKFKALFDQQFKLDGMAEEEIPPPTPSEAFALPRAGRN